MRIIITGSRYWNDPHYIEQFLAHFKRALDGGPMVTFVHGGARGLDSMFAALARRKGFETEAHLAEWGRFGKVAGHIRNADMLRSGGISACIGFKDGFRWQLDHGGTEHMVMIAQRAGLPVEVFCHGPEDGPYRSTPDGLVKGWE